MWVPLLLSLLGVFNPTHRIVYSEPPAIGWLQVKFSYPELVPMEISASRFLCKFWFSVSSCLSLQFWRQHFALWPHFSDWSKKSFVFYLFSLLLVVSMKWQLLSSLHAKLEIWASHILSSLKKKKKLRSRVPTVVQQKWTWTGIHADMGSISGLTQCVKDLALLWTVV